MNLGNVGAIDASLWTMIEVMGGCAGALGGVSSSFYLLNTTGKYTYSLFSANLPPVENNPLRIVNTWTKEKIG